MKRINTKTTKRVAAIILAAFTACSVMGCSVEKNFTKTETHTYTDADGNTVTTTKTNNNGVITTETTKTSAENVNTSVEVEETEEEAPAVFSKVPLVIENNMGWDIAAINLKMSTDEQWSDNFLSEDTYIEDGIVARGIWVSYDEENRFIDIRVADSEGEGIDFNGFELPTEVGDEIVLSFEYDASTGLYTVSSIS